MIDKEIVIGNVKTLLGFKTDDNDSLINLLIDKAEQDIKVFCNTDFTVDEVYTFPSNLVSTLEDLVLYRFNMLGAEGYKSERLGSREVQFTTELPNDIKQRLYPYRQMRVW